MAVLSIDAPRQGVVYSFHFGPLFVDLVFADHAEATALAERSGFDITTLQTKGA